MIRKIANSFYLTCGALAAFCMLSLVLIILAQIIARLIGGNIPSSDDVSGYLVASTTFFGLSYAMNSGEHIRVDLFVNLLPYKFKRILLSFTCAVGLLLISSFFYYVVMMVQESYEYEDLTSGQIAFPLWVVQMPYVLGVFALVVSVIDQFQKTLRGKGGMIK